jgi:hypothetical protein
MAEGHRRVRCLEKYCQACRDTNTWKTPPRSRAQNPVLPFFLQAVLPAVLAPCLYRPYLKRRHLFRAAQTEPKLGMPEQMHDVLQQFNCSRATTPEAGSQVSLAASVRVDFVMMLYVFFALALVAQSVAGLQVWQRVARVEAKSCLGRRGSTALFAKRRTNLPRTGPSALPQTPPPPPPAPSSPAPAPAPALAAEPEPAEVVLQDGELAEVGAQPDVGLTVAEAYAEEAVAYLPPLPNPNPIYPIPPTHSARTTIRETTASSSCAR